MLYIYKDNRAQTTTTIRTSMTNGNIFAAIQEMFKIRHYARKLKMP